MRRPNRSWRVDETYVRVAGKWVYLYRAVDWDTIDFMLSPNRDLTAAKHDPQFAEKLEAIVSLYLSPPEHALVLCVDEKSQIQALDRTQPGLPLKRGRGATMTHDYKRNGTALCLRRSTPATAR
jgi:hypothetical protein